jgi:phytoene dehydrogenase-like protein
VTVSAAADKLKAPEGYRTVTVSTHTPAQEWFKLSKAEYKERKQVVENFIVAQLKAYLPELFSETDELLYLCSGTAKTFEYYTQRAHGVVGGLPFDVDYNLFDLVHKKVPKHRYYHLGDTGFPGQGIASVIYSGFSAVEGS